ncbi:diguanylate cyclase [Sulfitobacter sp. LCG007]
MAKTLSRATTVGDVRAFIWALATLGLGGASAAVAYWAPPVISERIVEADVRADAVLWHRRLITMLENGAETFVRGDVTDEDRGYLSTISNASDVYRLMLFTKDGAVFWSTRETDIGTVSEQGYFHDTVMAGEVYYKTDLKPYSEIDNAAMHTLTGPDNIGENHHVAEIYTPVIFDGEVVGAVEFYKEYNATRTVLVDRLRYSIALVGVLLTLVTGISTFLISRVSRRQRELARERRSQEKENLEIQMRLVREVTLLGELNEWLQSSSSLEELFEMVSRYLAHILPESEGEIYIYSNSRDVLDGGASWNGATVPPHIRPGDCWGLRRGRHYHYGESEVNFACDHTDAGDTRPYFCFPILARGETVGLMHLRAKSEASTEEFMASRKLAQLCAEQISMAISNVRMRDELHDQSVRDPLTGLFNRRHLTEMLRRALDKAMREVSSVAVISVDIDHFKKFNDTYGHDAGDMVLRAVSQTLARIVDGDELACRMGGEELLVLLPGANLDDASVRAEAIRQAIEAVSVHYGEKTLPSITVSIGVAACPEHGQSPQDLIRAADDALYRAKDGGRNRVEVATTVRDGAPDPAPVRVANL